MSGLLLDVTLLKYIVTKVVFFSCCF